MSKRKPGSDSEAEIDRSCFIDVLHIASVFEMPACTGLNVNAGCPCDVILEAGLGRC